MTPIQILKGAREILSDERRWTKRWYNSGDCHCLAGAMIKTIQTADPYTFTPFRMIEENSQYQDAIRKLGFDRMGDLFNWNDADERTHPEVLARLDGAIAHEP